jgi:hypothetical protein
MALGSRPILPGWAGTLAETSSISLAKIRDETAHSKVHIKPQGILKQRSQRH